ncbi:MAG TPA: hypothetical protein VIH09_00335 [Flavobacterium sp.]|uniref:hypothetical protein n=1 Tax=Flavobacterium sp. TaxID=239 RepID=UPI002F40C92A
MKIRIFLLFFFVASYSYSQSINDYKAVIVPVKFDFLKSDNQYRLATVSKYNLNKAGFQAYYDNEPLSDENVDRCSLLNFDVIKESSFLTTKLYVVFKDCFGKIIFQSETGVSKEKDFELAYKEALNKAFVSVYALRYTYRAKDIVNASPSAKAKAVTEAVPVPAEISVESVNTEKASSTLLYAQPTATGFQLVDNKPSVVMNVYKTSTKDCYIAVKGNRQGVLMAKGNEWFFEYYQNDNLISEKMEVKF